MGGMKEHWDIEQTGVSNILTCMFLADTVLSFKLVCPGVA